MAVLVADPTLPPLAQVCGAHLCSFRHRKEPPSSPPELLRARGGTQSLQPPPPCRSRPQESPPPPPPRRMPTPRRLPPHLPTASGCSGPANRRAAQDGGPFPPPAGEPATGASWVWGAPGWAGQRRGSAPAAAGKGLGTKGRRENRGKSPHAPWPCDGLTRQRRARRRPVPPLEDLGDLAPGTGRGRRVCCARGAASSHSCEWPQRPAVTAA